MLKEIQIEDLYGLYSYNLTMLSGEEPIRFITGPNGYGKTTILNILNSVFSQDWQKLLSIDFTTVKLMMDDNYSILIERKNVLQDVEEEYDNIPTVDYKLNVSFYMGDAREVSMTVKSGDEDVEQNALSLYLDSHPLYYVSDDRLWKRKDGESFFEKDVKMLRSLLLGNENKLYSDEELNSRVALFEGIVERSEFANKRMEVSKDFGFRFVSADSDRTILDKESQFSSGERHLLVQLFDLLFNAADSSIVLIDEPELSFHLSWQTQFLDNIKSISKLRPFLQFVICTHSTDVFSYKWGYTVDLYEQSKA